MTPAAILAAYYRWPEVRSRIAEYCGGAPELPEAFTSWDLAGYGGRRQLHETDGAPVSAPNCEFGTLLEDPEGFSCASQAARGVCPAQGCGWDLARLMESVGAS